MITVIRAAAWIFFGAFLALSAVAIGQAVAIRSGQLFVCHRCAP